MYIELVVLVVCAFHHEFESFFPWPAENVLQAVLFSDIDECALTTTCPRGTCTNTEGSFTCINCQPGFRVSEDGQQCDGEAFGCVCAFVMFVFFSTGVCSFLFYSDMPGLALIPTKVAVKGECASCFRLYVNSIRCDNVDPKAPSSELKRPKYSF